MAEALTFVWELKEGHIFGLFGKNNGAKAGEKRSCESSCIKAAPPRSCKVNITRRGVLRLLQECALMLFYKRQGKHCVCKQGANGLERTYVEALCERNGCCM